MYRCEYSLLTVRIVLAHHYHSFLLLGSFAAISIFLIYIMEPLVKSIRRVIRRVKSRPPPEVPVPGETDVEKQELGMDNSPPLLQVNGQLPVAQSSSTIRCSSSVMRELSSESLEIIHPLHRCFERSGSTPDITNPRIFWRNSFISESELEHMGGGRPSIVKRVTTGFNSMSRAGSRLSLQKPRSALLRTSTTPSLARLSFLEGLPSIKGTSGLNTLDELTKEDDTPCINDHHDGASIFGPPTHSSTPAKRVPSRSHT